MALHPDHVVLIIVAALATNGDAARMDRWMLMYDDYRTLVGDRRLARA